MLALLTSASRPPTSRAPSARAALCPGSETSPGMASTRVCSDNSVRALSRASSPLASMIRVQPSSARARASARPRPREAPVMSAVRCGDGSLISCSSRSRSNTMYRRRLRRRTAGGTVFVLYLGTGSSVSIRRPALLVFGVSLRTAAGRLGTVHGLHEPALGGNPGRLGAVLGFEFCEDGADMELDRPLRDKEPAGDLGVLQAAGEEREHLEFPGRETPILRNVFLAVYAI